MEARPHPDTAHSLFCSFCGKNADSVSMLIAGPNVHICDGCVELCNEIIAKEETKRANTSDANGFNQ